MAASTRMRLIIHGEVQGVGFRFHARRRAAALGLSGWVRNRPDGTVEAVAEGPDDAVRSFMAWAQQGPSAASVTRVETYPEQPHGEDPIFRITN